MVSDERHYREIFDYLSAEDLPTEREPAVVFGRKDPLVAQAVGDLIIDDLVEVPVLTGGIGKDSGNLLQQGYRSEAHFLLLSLKEDADDRGYELPPTMLDEEASNGGENARNSLALFNNMGFSTDSMTAVSHATSLRRLAETLAFEAGKLSEDTPVVHKKASAYEFNPNNPFDRDESAAELLRLADWPAKGFLGEQADLPEDLVDFVRDTHGNAPKPVSPLQSAILRRLPKSTQSTIINFAVRHGRK